MSSPYPTLEVLLELGFEDRPPLIQVPQSVGWMVPAHLRSPSVSVCYRFADFDLVARPETRTIGHIVVALSGVRYTGRDLSMIEAEIPANLGTAKEAAAWASYALQSDRGELKPLPDWFIEGERNWDLIPFVREDRERRRAYETSPKCFIDRDYARPLRRNLANEISWLREETEMTFSFDGRVLGIKIFDRAYEVLASGDGWHSSYRVLVSRESKLPARFMSSRVEVNVLGGHLRVDGLPLGPCESGP